MAMFSRSDPSRGRSRTTAAWRITAVVAAALLSGACVSVPAEPEPSLPANSVKQVRVVGARGPLSRRQTAAVLRRLAQQAPDADALAKHLAIEQAVAGAPLYAGNGVRVLQDGRDTFPAMFAAIRSARRSLWLEYFIFEDVHCDGAALVDLLLARRAEGVQVAVLYDSVGSSATPAAVFDRLRAGGVQVLAFNPVNPLNAHGHWSLNDRDHRKLLIADDTLAIMGGINLSSDYETGAADSAGGPPPSAGADHPYWRDTDIEIAGPAVGAVARLFRSHWLDQGGPALPELKDPVAMTPAGGVVMRIIGSAPAALAPRYYATLLSSIRTAEQRLWITAAYFVPTHQERSAMIAAARRGVDVQLLVPTTSDSPAALAVQRAAYGDLLQAGVKIYEREGVVLHTKCVMVDGVWTIIGSSNFDHRSVLFNDEVDAVVLDSAVVADLERRFADDRAAARPVDERTWRHRSLRERIRETFWRSLTSLL